MTEYDVHNPPLMKCGCSANSDHVRADGTREPACLIHDCFEIIEKPSLEGRRARCAYFGQLHGRSYGPIYGGSEADIRATGRCNSECDSSYGLPFFEYKGPGSRASEEACKNCGYFKSVHPSQNPESNGCYKINGRPIPGLCENEGGTFESHGTYDFDKFYCGCFGWD